MMQITLTHIMDTALETGIGLYHLLALAFSVWILPRTLRTFRSGPTLYLMGHTLFWLGNLYAFAHLERGMPDGSHIHPLGTVLYGVLCFHIGIYMHFTPKEFRLETTRTT